MISNKTGGLLASVCVVAQGRVSINNSEDVPAQKKTQTLMSWIPQRGWTDSLGYTDIQKTNPGPTG